jgi:hypothetical protein
VKQNNTINMYEDYFTGSEEGSGGAQGVAGPGAAAAAGSGSGVGGVGAAHSSEVPSARTLAVFR